MQPSKQAFLAVCLSLVSVPSAGIGQSLSLSLASIQMEEPRLDGAVGPEITAVVPLNTYVNAFLGYRYVAKNVEKPGFTCDTYWPSFDNCVAEDLAIDSSLQTATVLVFFEAQRGHVGLGTGAGLAFSFVRLSERGVRTGRDLGVRVPGGPLTGFVVLARAEYQPWTAYPFRVVASGSTDSASLGPCSPDAMELCGTGNLIAWSVGAAYAF